MNAFFRAISNFFNRLFGNNTIAPDYPPIQNPVIEVKVPEVKIPEVKIPEVKAPEIEIPEVKIPEVKIPEIEVPDVNIPEIEIPEVKVPEVSIPDSELSPEPFSVPEVEVTVTPEEFPAKVTPETPSSSIIPPIQENSFIQPETVAGELPLALQIRLKRQSAGALDTLGKMSINGLEYCYSLEETKGKAIPVGKYEVLLRSSGGIHATYATRYKELHKGMLWLQNVPGFKYIYIQIGQDTLDTQGCIIVGNEVVNEAEVNAKRIIKGSKAAYLKIYVPVAEYLLRGGKVFINIED